MGKVNPSGLLTMRIGLDHRMGTDLMKQNLSQQDPETAEIFLWIYHLWRYLVML